jgi:hypothetical protein
MMLLFLNSSDFLDVLRSKNERLVLARVLFAVAVSITGITIMPTATYAARDIQPAESRDREDATTTQMETAMPRNRNQSPKGAL